jgi:arylsulfatase A-like enzyme
VGHLKGPDDPEIAVQLASQDAELSRLFAGLGARNAWPFTTVVVSSDHGMTSGSIEINIASVLSDEGIESRYDSDGAVAYVTLSDLSELDRAKAALESVAGHTVYRSDALPEGLHITSPGRNGDLVLVAEAPHYYSKSGTLSRWLGRLAQAFGADRGTHGYAPDQPDMAGILYMLGRGVEQGATLDAVSNLDIAPTVSRLLGIDPPADCEGKVLYEIVGEVK